MPAPSMPAVQLNPESAMLAAASWLVDGLLTLHTHSRVLVRGPYRLWLAVADVGGRRLVRVGRIEPPGVEN